jgi:hypothetical protein
MVTKQGADHLPSAEGGYRGKSDRAPSSISFALALTQRDFFQDNSERLASQVANKEAMASAEADHCPDPDGPGEYQTIAAFKYELVDGTVPRQLRSGGHDVQQVTGLSCRLLKKATTGRGRHCEPLNSKIDLRS